MERKLHVPSYMNRRAWVTWSCLGDIKSSWSKWYMIRNLKDNLEVIINDDDNTSWAFTVSGAIVCALHVWYQLFYCLDSSFNQFRIQVLTLACFFTEQVGEKRGASSSKRGPKHKSLVVAENRHMSHLRSWEKDEVFGIILCKMLSGKRPPLFSSKCEYVGE